MSLKRIVFFLLVIISINAQGKCIPPKYNFVFEIGVRYGEIFTVRNGTLEKIYIPPPENADLDKIKKDKARLFVYDVRKHIFDEASYENLKKMNLFINMNPLQGTIVSSDGYTIVDKGRNGHGYEALPFLAIDALRGINHNYFYIEGHGCSIKLSLPKNYNGHYPTVLAWIID